MSGGNIITLDAERWEAFMAALDRAPRELSSMPKLLALLQSPSPFDESSHGETAEQGGLW